VKLLVGTICLVIVFAACNKGLYTYYDDDPYYKAQGPEKSSPKGMPNEPGKCYARCLIQDEFVSNDADTIGVFGIDEAIPEEYYKEVKIRPASTKWVKKKADKNCLSADPNDCLVWCLQETPAQYEYPVIVTDSSGIEPLVYVVLPGEDVMVKEGGYTEWREVICEKDISRSLVTKIHSTLFDLQYEVGPMPENGRFNSVLKSALVKFQKENGFPVGQLDMDTLEGLGVEY